MRRGIIEGCLRVAIAAAFAALCFGQWPWIPSRSTGSRRTARQESKAPGSPVDATTSILMALSEKLEKGDLRKVVLRKQITPQKLDRAAELAAEPSRPRRFFPRGSDLSIVSDTDVQRVEDKLNSRPRKILGYRAPREVFFNAKTLPVALRC
jgi:hypothetical protein